MSLDSKVALILNPKAGGFFSGSRKKKFSELSGVHIFKPTCEEEANDNAIQIIEEGITVVATGGGDGTIYHTWNSIHNALNKYPGKTHPKYKLLRMGTGNALANLVKASANLDKFLEFLKISNHGYTPLPVEHKIPLIKIAANYDSREIKQSHFSFAGVGWDALILENYNQMKKNTNGIIRNVPGYLLAGLTGLTQVLAGKKSNVRVTSENVHKIISEIEIEEVPYLELNDVNMGGVSNVVEYGHNFRAFPYANRGTNKMNLRVITGSPRTNGAKLLLNAYSVWKGTYKPEFVLDYLVEKVKFTYTGLGKSTPAQTAGESLGNIESLHCQTTKLVIEVI